MSGIAVWTVDEDNAPKRLTPDRAFLERHLEDWIEASPALLSSQIRWVARQLRLPDGSILDLIGVTNDGTWVIAELKAVAVDGATVRQVLHYFMEIASMTNGELANAISAASQHYNQTDVIDALREDADDVHREYQLIVAGIGSSARAESATAVLSQFGFQVPIHIVSFEVLADISGRRLLVREVDDDRREGTSVEPGHWSYDALLERAEGFGVRAGFERIRAELIERGFRPFQRKHGLNFNRGTRRQWLWVMPAPHTIEVGYCGWNLPALLGIDEDAAADVLGPNWLRLEPSAAHAKVIEWAEQFNKLAPRTSDE